VQRLQYENGQLKGNTLANWEPMEQCDSSYGFSVIVYRVRLKFHLARLNSTRLDTFDFVEPVETSASSETSRALPTWRTTNDLAQV